MLSFQLLYGTEKNQTIRFEWKKVNDILDMSRRLKIVQNETDKTELTIKEVVESDQGQYLCIAYNEFGNTTEEVYLYVKTHWSFIIPLIIIIIEILAMIIIMHVFKQEKSNKKNS